MKRKINEFNLIQSAITYLREDLGFKIVDYEVPFNMGQMKYRADIVVYRTENNQEIPYILVEVKANEEIGKYAWIQAETYAKRLKTPYFAITNGNKWSWFKTGKIGESLRIDVDKIDIKGINTETKITIKNSKQFLDILNQMKYVLYNNEKLEPDKIFYELIKVIFVKFELEKDPYDDNFLIDDNVKQSHRIKDFYQKRIEKYPNLIGPRLSENFFKINLNDKTIFELIGILRPYKLFNSNNSEVSFFNLPLNFESKRKSIGNFYIPNELSQFIVNFLKPDIDDLILDPACNNGALLMDIINKKFELLESPRKQDVIEEKISKKIKGFEFNPNLYWLTCMNLLIHGYDINGISILNTEKFKENQEYDKIYCFPPFGRLNNLNLPYIFNDINFRLRFIEEFFLVMSIKLLKKSGKLIIILPDRYLTSNSAKKLRNYLKEKMNILSIVSLPQNSFLDTSTKTSVLLLEKKDDFSQQGPVFMANLDSKSLHKKEFSYDSILKDYLIFKEKNIEQKIISENSYSVNGNIISENDVLSPSYYDPEYLEIKNQLKKLKSFKLKDLAEKIATGHRFKDEYKTFENRIPIIKNKNINEGKIIEKDLIFIDKNHPRIQLWPPGTLIISKIGKNNKITILTSDFPEYAIDGNLIGIKLNKNILPKYLAVFLNSKYGKVQLDTIKDNGIIPQLNTSDLKNVIIPFYSIENQKRIIDLIDKNGDEILFEVK